jgi:hypothetical protein
VLDVLFDVQYLNVLQTVSSATRIAQDVWEKNSFYHQFLHSSGHHMMTSGGLALTAAGGQGVLKVAPQLYAGGQQPMATIQQQQQVRF